MIGKKYGDLTGQIFGKWIVLYNGENDKYNRPTWFCECQCKKKTIRLVSQRGLISGKSTSCGCSRIKNNIIGMKFGKLTVIEESNEYNSQGQILYKCICSCKDKTIKLVSRNNLMGGTVKSCGCLNTDDRRKQNKYDLTGEYGIGFTCNNDKFYFDLEDYDKIKNYCWNMHPEGYINTSGGKSKTINMHRLVMNLTDKNFSIDHIYGIRWDNRKSQLRIVSHQQNSINKKKNIKNKSGVTGVSWNKKDKAWVTNIMNNGKNYSKEFDTFDEAVTQRKAWEEEFFKEYAYKEPPPEYIAELQN